MYTPPPISVTTNKSYWCLKRTTGVLAEAPRCVSDAKGWNVEFQHKHSQYKLGLTSDRNSNRAACEKSFVSMNANDTQQTPYYITVQGNTYVFLLRERRQSDPLPEQLQLKQTFS